MKDSQLKQDILDELEFEPSIDANDIGVTVEDGIVTLSGHVPNYSQKLAVERLVSHLKGVRGIAEEIEVRYPNGPGMADDEIAARVVNTLKWSTLVPDNKVLVKVEEGWVTLTGKLEWNYQKVGAADAIRDIKGVTGISNQIELVQRVSSVDVKKRIEEALKRNAQLESDSIKVDVAGNKVILKGHVKAWSERRLVEQAVWATPGVTVVSDQLMIG
ncbi:MAG TPA: BON domain-containing protein [Devosia sp.]